MTSNTTSTHHDIHDRIEKAATTVGAVWPLHSFVTANPLAGFEDLPFDEAVTQGADLFGGHGYPSAATFRRALETGQIDPDILETELAARGYEAAPETLLDRLDTTVPAAAPDPAVERVDRVLTKWLAMFLDEGQAQWPMPNREAGFYAAVRGVAAADGAIPDGALTDRPATPGAAIEAVLASYPESQWVPIFEEQLAALPGWTGLIKQRADSDSPWQSAHPITLADYLAVRLALLDGVGVDLSPPTGPDTTEATPTDDLAAAFLTAWEATYRTGLVDRVAAESRTAAETESTDRPAAQLVFCIDTRSEVIRRHIEATGAYETHGYAGFFGIPMEYQGYDDAVATAACPPILEPTTRITELPTGGATQAHHDRWRRLTTAAREVVETLKSNAAAAFGFVESAGSGYGLALAARTLMPGRVANLVDTADTAPDSHEFCTQTVGYQHSYIDDLPVGLTTDEQVAYAAAAVEQMGWETFGRLVVFTGHASETTNNPHAASLDCGACAGNPGGPNARVLAAICNDPDVQAGLRERGIAVPDDTVFLAAEHTTTTDEINLYDDHVPASHADDLAQLRADLATARERATAERAAAMDAADSDAVNETRRRAADWAETRPEWGLAGNAAFVVGPRELTRDLDLDGRAFLHSYDWATDAEGDALEAILTGPMVVTQWINTQYYFATVDPAVYGSGSKVTHNPVGNVGVYQGNGGDLMAGLPAQSVLAAHDEVYHQPLRLSTVVHAPVDRVTDVLAAHDHLQTLLDNDWLSLTVVDPQQAHRAFEYDSDLTWTPMAGPTDTATPEQQVSEPPAATDD